MKFNVGIRFISFRSKLTAAFMLTIIPIILLGVLSANKSANAIKETTSSATIQTMEQANRYLDLLLWNIESTSLQISQSKAFLDFSDNTGTIPDEKKADFESLLDNIKKSSTFISDILVIAKNGQAVSTGGHPVNSLNVDELRNSSFYKKAARVNGGIVWLSLHPELDKLSGTNSSQYSLYATRLVKDNVSGDKGSLILIDIKYEFIKNLLESIKIGNGSEVHLISPDGRDISVFSKSDKSASDQLKIPEMTFFKKIKNGTNLSGSEFIKYSDNNYLLTYSRLGTTGYILLGLLPDSALYSASRSIVLVTFLLVGSAAMIAIVLGLLFAFRTGRILKEVTVSADQAAKGDLTVKIHSQSKDEFGMLAQSISKMISDMQYLISGASKLTSRVVSSTGVVSDTSRHVSNISNEVSQVVRQIAEGAGRQSYGTEAATSKILELSEKIKSVSDNTGKIENLSNQSLDLTENSAASIRRLSSECSIVADVTGEMISDIHLLKDYSKDLGKLVKVISSIAEQTNLLALNAAIEAAHAGDAGLGFSVVSEEIRKLADMALTSSREAENIIKLVNNKINDTSRNAVSAESLVKIQNEALSDTTSTFDRVSSAMNTLNVKVRDIRQKTSDMEQHKDDVVKAISEVSDISQEAAAATQELSASIDDQDTRISLLVDYVSELDEACNELSESLGRFKI